jgi:hypothetical protein
MHEAQVVLQAPAKKPMRVGSKKPPPPKPETVSEIASVRRIATIAVNPPTPTRLGNAKRLAVRFPRQLPHRNRRRNPMSRLGQGRDCFGDFGKGRNKIR